MTETQQLFTPATLGDIEVANRILMAPLTRSRADNATDTPSPLATDYYRQRATAGLIITEATQISPTAKGYIGTPGLYTDAHTAAWKTITDAVHAEGGKIVSQLWHVGRISHTSLLPEGEAPLAPSAKRAQSQTFTAEGPADVSEPRAMDGDDFDRVVCDYVKAARRALEAGFDGVEVHSANGYLLDQFLQSSTNARTDAYGGSVENRLRFPLQVIDAVIKVVGAGRVGIRLSPTGTFNDMGDENPEETFGAFIDALNARGLAYLHIVEDFAGSGTEESRALVGRLRARWSGAYIANGGYDAARGEAAISSGHADAVTYGVPFIGNPDLVERYRTGAALNDADQATFYGGGAEGYVDYPRLTDTAAA